MTQELWTAVDRYLADVLIEPDPMLTSVLDASTKAGLPAINVTPHQGKLLHLLARLQGATTILEIGTLAGYSTIWLARALPPTGKVISLEVDGRHAEMARANIERAGLSGVVDVRLGAAIETLPKLAKEGKGPFDLIFIDADKASVPDYFTWSLKLSHPGTLIIIDNVVREGAILDASSEDPNVRGLRRLNEMLRTESRVTATAIQTVGSKGYDGFTLALVRKPNGARQT